MPLIRPELTTDTAAIHALIAASFPTPGEAELVDRLREAGRLRVSLAAEEGGQIVGHIAISPVTTPSQATGAGLGPLAVAESHRRRGIGAALMGAGLDACRAAGLGWAVVLGDPAYYARFGFRPAGEFGLHDEHGWGRAFQALELLPGGLPTEGGLVRYAPEFDSLS
ncbi:hypothetical protein Pla175_45500 [Pirellulimonas nuda]|uniref:N-acetyltransferase domain-containing protein n=1 Tax=Pirellulimonas nuda TaxID=2528009 RepID=A0A518DI19_9BACT|nr:N-acetyltransferase [Pirellulimonas nuda]QDU91131.1 hypothetical protein Pla175_45500 [Pirellulimonas nuda]